MRVYTGNSLKFVFKYQLNFGIVILCKKYNSPFMLFPMLMCIEQLLVTIDVAFFAWK